MVCMVKHTMDRHQKLLAELEKEQGRQDRVFVSWVIALLVGLGVIGLVILVEILTMV